MSRRGKDLTIDDVRIYVDAPQPTILEIGCNDGTDTNRFLDIFPEGYVHCFEPDPRAIERFRETIKPEHSSRMNLNCVAVSDEDSTATFHGSSGKPPEKSRHPGATHYCYLDEWDLSGSLCVPTGHLQFSPWTTFPDDRKYQVETVRLDTWLMYADYFFPNGTIDFIWCDVQGAEAKVIRGAEKTLGITRYLYTEFYDHPLYEGQLPLTELAKLLPGFELLSIHGDNALFKNRAI